MFIQTYTPHMQLSGVVDRYAIIQYRQPQPLPPERYQPAGNAGMLLNLNPDYAGNEHRLNKSPVPACAILGPTTRYADLEFSTPADMLVVRFHPTGLYHLCRIPLHHFTNQAISLSHIPALYDQEVIVQLTAAQQAEQKTGIMDQFFLRLLQQFRRQTGPAEQALQLIHQNSQIHSVEMLAEMLYISRRHLIRVFLERVGMNPKDYMRITRFERVVRLLKSDRNLSLQDVLHQCGYYDQSHFNKDFMKLMNKKPKSFTREARAIADFLYQL